MPSREFYVKRGDQRKAYANGRQVHYWWHIINKRTNNIEETLKSRDIARKKLKDSKYWVVQIAA